MCENNKYCIFTGKYLTIRVKRKVPIAGFKPYYSICHVLSCYGYSQHALLIRIPRLVRHVQIESSISISVLQSPLYICAFNCAFTYPHPYGEPKLVCICVYPSEKYKKTTHPINYANYLNSPKPQNQRTTILLLK